MSSTSALTFLFTARKHINNQSKLTKLNVLYRWRIVVRFCRSQVLHWYRMWRWQFLPSLPPELREPRLTCFVFCFVTQSWIHESMSFLRRLVVYRGDFSFQAQFHSGYWSKKKISCRVYIMQVTVRETRPCFCLVIFHSPSQAMECGFPWFPLPGLSWTVSSWLTQTHDDAR